MPAASEPPAPPRNSPVARITRSEWALILVLVAIQFTHMVDFVIIMPLGGRLMRELELSESQFAHIVSAYAWAAGIASLLASFVMDRFDRKIVLLAMYAGFGVSTIVCGLASNYTGLLLSRTLAGGFGGTAAVALMAVIGDIFPPEKRGRASGAVMSSFAVASIAGLPAGLLLAEYFGRGAPFLALAGFSACVWLTALLRLPPIRGHLTSHRPDRLAEFALVVSEPRYLGAFAFSFFLVLGTFTVASFLGPYLSTINNWSEHQLAEIYFIAGSCTLVGMTAIGWLSDRRARLPLFRIIGSIALVMALIVTNIPARTMTSAAVLMSLFMVAAAGRMVPVQALLLGVARPANRGAFMSVNTAVQHAATGLAPLVTGMLVKLSPAWTTVLPNAGWVGALTAVEAQPMGPGMPPMLTGAALASQVGVVTGFQLAGLFAATTAAISLVLAGVLHRAPQDNSPLDAAEGLSSIDARVAGDGPCQIHEAIVRPKQSEVCPVSTLPTGGTLTSRSS